MSLVPAQITVNFTANYNGPHRVCYRVVGEPTYICTVAGSPAGSPGINPNCGAGPCSYVIDILVDNETCDTIEYEGYTQAQCELEGSTAGRDAFAAVVSFIPEPECKRYAAGCVSSGIGLGTIVDGGSAYPGDGVFVCPAVGTGTLGTYNVTIAGGIVTGIAILVPGTGYTAVPTIDLTPLGVSGGGVAILTASLNGCSVLTPSDCGDTASGTIPDGTFQPGEIYYMCSESGTPVVPADWVINEVGNCLCDCIEQDLQETNDTGTIDYRYIDCDGNAVTGTLNALETTGNVCMVDGSLETTINGGAVLNIAVVGPCNAVAP